MAKTSEPTPTTWIPAPHDHGVPAPAVEVVTEVAPSE